MAVLELINVCKGYGTGADRQEVLHNLNLTVEEGEFLAIVGFSGSGKTTLMKIIAGLISPDSGEVLYKGKKVTRPSNERGLIFQNYSLLPWLSVYENVALSVNAVFKDKSKIVRERIVRETVEMVNLTPAINKKPKELSGGMKQRVSVARALAVDPELLLMDEPLSALDALTRGNLQEEILSIWSKNKRTAVLISNDVDEAIFMADRVIALNQGPKATFGPEFKVGLDRPRDKAELNSNEDFIKTRNTILEYLMEIGVSINDNTADEIILPDLRPIDKSIKFKSKNAA